MAGLRKRRPTWSAEGLLSQHDLHDILDDVDRQLRSLDKRTVEGVHDHSVNVAGIQRVTTIVTGGGGGSTTPTLHNELEGKQGGLETDQFYHLSAAQWGVYGLHNSLTDLQGGTIPDEFFHFNELHHAQLAATIGADAGAWAAYQTALYGTSAILSSTAAYLLHLLGAYTPDGTTHKANVIYFGDATDSIRTQMGHYDDNRFAWWGDGANFGIYTDGSIIFHAGAASAAQAPSMTIVGDNASVLGYWGFTGDPDTYISNPAANAIGIVLGGTERLRITSPSAGVVVFSVP